MPKDQPLILTLNLDPATQAAYDDLRQQYFPPERNLIPAHLTLFHHLPDEDATYNTVSRIAQTTAPAPLTQPTLRSIGRGVAVFFQAPEITRLHAALSHAFEPHLIPQDRQPLRPHIVLQNKVDPATARRTLHELAPHPFPAPQAVGLTLWRYLNGPWRHLQTLPFQAQTDTPPTRV